MKPQKTLNSQINLGKEKQNWRSHNSRLQVILQSYSNQQYAWLAQSEEHATLDLRVMSLSHMFGVEIT